MLESLSLDGKVVVVTGGGTGLGRAMGRHLARAGADIVIAGRRPGPIEEAAEEFTSMGRRALAIPTDVTDSSQVDALIARAIARLGRVDVLVNNAGGGGGGGKQLWEITDEEWRSRHRHQPHRGVLLLASGHEAHGGPGKRSHHQHLVRARG